MRRSGSTFGLTEEQWNEAKAEVREAIVEAARDNRMTWYSEVASQVTAVSLDPYSSLMNHLLGAVFEDEHAAGRPALTSLVTHKEGDREPGTGFYDEARALGYSIPRSGMAQVEFWAVQVQRVFQLYGRRR